MRRHAFVREEQLRPEIPFRKFIIFDGVINYGQASLLTTRLSSCQLTVYKRNDTILAIAHEDPANRGATIGEGALSIWSHVDSWVQNNVNHQEVNLNMVRIQGHDGFYEYIKPKPPKFPIQNDSRIFVIAGMSSHAHDKYEWTAAGTLEEVLERHLK